MDAGGALHSVSAFFCFLPMLLLAIVAFILWVWMLYECLAKEPSNTEKLVWVIVILALQFVGALLYLFIRRPQRIREQGE